MALETAVYLNTLDAANPAGPDRLAVGDDHIRMIKRVLKDTLPNITGPVTMTQAQLNSIPNLAVVPFGMISLWYGSSATIPAGYALCDGSLAVPKSDGSGTIAVPDLRGRVAVGASAANPTGTYFGQDARSVTSGLGGIHSHAGSVAEAGAHTHALAIDGTALTVSQLPAHSHGLSISSLSMVAHDSSAEGDRTVQSGAANAAGYVESVGSGATHTHTGSAAEAGSHTHAITTADSAAHAHSVDVTVVQASMALHYIMKV